MKLLITGSRGFIGQNLVKYLSNFNFEIDQFDIVEHSSIPRVNEIDISQYQWVIHLGAISSTTETNIAKVMDLNLTWAVELFESCVKHQTNFQWSSSASVYGLNSDFKESSQPNPKNLYARSKYLLEEYIKSRDVDIVWQGFRYFNVYGPHEQHKKTQASPHHQFEQQAQDNGVIKVFKNSENYFRDFVPVEHVCQTHLKFLDINTSGIFNVGTGQATSFHSVAQRIAEKYQARIEVVPMPDQLKQHYQTYTRADMTHTHQTIADNKYKY